MAESKAQSGRREDLGTVGAWVRMDDDAALTARAFAVAAELGWGDGSKEEYFAFISGYRVGAQREGESELDSPGGR